MPSASSLTINDGTNNKTYVPVAVSPEKSLFVDRSSTTSAGNPKLVLGLSSATAQRPTNRVSYRFEMPVEYTADGITLVRDVPRAITDVVLPDAMTSAERTVFWTLYLNQLANATVKGYVLSLEPCW